MDPPPAPQPITSHTGKYRVIAELGQGGMANVYLAVARGPSGFNKLVVLKSLRTDIAVDPQFMKMFLEEARLAARLNHPNVVQTYEVGEYAGRPVIVMEYLDGQTLANVEIRAKSKLTLGLRLRMLIEALEGLHHAHELTDFSGQPLGIVHRDVSPQNVFVTFDGHVKVLDFGIAKVVNSHVQTVTGTFKGKVRYMAPEQMLGTKDLDRRADIFAVGVMLWESIVGKRMWQDKSDIQVMTAIANGDMVPPRAVHPETSESLDAICMRALAPDPAERFSTALEMANALEEELERMGTGASNRQLGQILRESFEDLRARTRASIEAQLAGVSLADDSGMQAIPTDLVNISARVTEESQEKRSMSRPIQDRPRRSVVTAALGGLAVAVLVGVTFAVRSATKPDAAQPAASGGPLAAVSKEVPSSAPAMAAPTGSVHVHLSSVPSGAALSLDGDRLPGNPITAMIPLDGRTHFVTAKAPGYETRTLNFEPDHDTDLIVTLDPVRSNRGPTPVRPTPAPPPPAPGPVPVAPPPPPPTATSPQVNCNPPYVIDAEGIKRIRPECVGK